MIDVVTLPNPPKDSKVLVPIIQSQSIMIGLHCSTRDLIHWPKILILNDKYKSQPTIDLINWIIEHSIRAYYELKWFNIKKIPLHKFINCCWKEKSCLEMTRFDKCINCFIFLLLGKVVKKWQHLTNRLIVSFFF